MAGLDGETGVALEKAAMALGALHARVAVSPLAPAWRARARLQAAAGAMAVDGANADAGRMAAILSGVPITLLDDYGEEMQALRWARVIEALEVGPGKRGDEQDMAAECVGYLVRAGEGAGLMRIGRSLKAWVEDGGSRAAGFVAVPSALVALGLCRQHLPVASFVPGADVHGSAWLPAFLDGLGAECRKGVQQIGTLEVDWRRWTGRLGARRKTSRHLQVMAVAASLGIVGPAKVAAVLGRMTRQGAGVVLGELAELGILKETTGRRTWKLYAVEDVWFSLPSPSRRPPARTAIADVIPSAAGEYEAGELPTLSPAPEPLPPMPEINLSHLYKELDRAMASSKRALAEVGDEWKGGSRDEEEDE